MSEDICGFLQSKTLSIFLDIFQYWDSMFDQFIEIPWNPPTVLMLNDSWVGDTYPEPLRFAYIITGMLYFLFGVSGNLLIIFSIMKVKRLRNNSNVFVINIAATDVVFAGYILPITMIDLLKGSYPTPELCSFNAALYRMSNMVSIIGKMLVAINRFYQICRPDMYQQIFKKRNVILMCSGVWLLAAISVCVNWVGVVTLEYDPQIHLCRVLFTRTIQGNVVYFSFSSLCIGIALIFYAKIYKKVKTSVNAFTSTYPQIPSNRFCRNALDSIRTNCIIFIVYIIVITPDMYLTIFVVQNVIIRAIAANLRFAGTGISFIMYGAMNNSISRTYKELLCCFECSCTVKETSVLVENNGESRNNTNGDIFHISREMQQRTEPMAIIGNSI